MPKYEFDAVRWLRNVAEIQSHRAGAGPAMLRENMLKCAEEVERLRMADDLNQQGAEEMRDEMARLKAELAALKEAARPVVRFWTDSKADFASMKISMPIGVSVEAVQLEEWVDITAEQFDKLALLCGEEKK